MIKHYFPALLLCCIFLIGVWARVYRLDSNPAGFFCDEAATGYNAYSILTTGKDEYGKPFPFFFQSFGNYRPGLPFYLTIPFIRVLGLNEVATRLPPVVYGSGTILLVYLLTFLLTKRRDIALVASLFLAISPWHIHFSRVDVLIIFPFFICLGVALFLKSVTSQKLCWWICASIAFGLSLYTYYQAYLFVPLILATLCVIYRDAINRYRGPAVIALIVLLFCTFPILYSLKTEPILGRFKQISPSFADKSTNEILSGIGSTYLGHFSLSFLFANGDIGYTNHFIQRYSVRGLGELYWLQLPFILVGLAASWKQKKTFFLLLFWLLLYPLGSSLAPFADGGGPFATRSIIGVIPFQILTGIGVVSVATRLKHAVLRYSFWTLVILLSIMSFTHYTYKYFVEYPLYSSDFWGWQYGPRDIMETFLTHRGAYDDYLIIGEFNAPEIFIKFYDPTNQCSSRCRIGGVSDINPHVRQLIALSYSARRQAPTLPFTVHKILYYPNGQPAFYIGTVQ